MRAKGKSAQVKAVAKRIGRSPVVFGDGPEKEWILSGGLTRVSRAARPGRPDLGLKLLQTGGLEIVQKLAARDPANAQWKTDLVISPGISRAPSSSRARRRSAKPAPTSSEH
jgi:hypothetical protein